MSTQPTTLKPSSRWGSFLQQAVAGVESRLDTILAEEDTTSARPKDTLNQQSGKTENSSASAKPTSSAGDIDPVPRPSLKIANAIIRHLSEPFPKQEE